MALVDRAARAAILAALGRIRVGAIELDERFAGGRRHRLGEERGGAIPIAVLDPSCYRRLVRGSNGYAEGYVDGLWYCPDLVGLNRLAARNMDGIDRLRLRFHRLAGPLARLSSRLHRSRNTPGGARRNISAHYDLGNELFERFLDESMTYSCAYFEEPGSSLDEAQRAKRRRLLERLRLSPDDHLLEIGTGWGALAIDAARDHGCRVTTTTISREQHELASERVRRAGLTDRVTVLFSDYRDLEGRFDKLVSVEMIEAVGWQYFPTFFRRCSELLEPHGAMALQAIVVDDRRYEAEKTKRSFSNTHIFPGGCLPSLELIGRLTARDTDMSIVWSDDISPHYARTLELWRERFLERFEELRPLGYDDRFRRLWELYLAFAEAGFRERRIRDVQLLMAKPAWREDEPALEPDVARGGARTEAAGAR